MREEIKVMVCGLGISPHKYAVVAQMVEREFEEFGVIGSLPVLGTKRDLVKRLPRKQPISEVYSVCGKADILAVFLWGYDVIDKHFWFRTKILWV